MWECKATSVPAVHTLCTHPAGKNCLIGSSTVKCGMGGGVLGVYLHRLLVIIRLLKSYEMS